MWESDISSLCGQFLFIKANNQHGCKWELKWSLVPQIWIHCAGFPISRLKGPFKPDYCKSNMVSLRHGLWLSYIILKGTRWYDKVLYMDAVIGWGVTCLFWAHRLFADAHKLPAHSKIWRKEKVQTEDIVSAERDTATHFWWDVSEN